ncbi:hypothetical protein [Bosea sp. 2RAB26]|uniref:hypothetical protein n=1 Tax=Bosea sp. 2RAB26 TaxID=3237476 RepID=UPI003F8DF683
MIEAVMLVTLGFLTAILLALAALPALARRADRLARRRAEAAFPLSLAEIAADRDHLRAELAMQARALEQRAESGFAARAGAMEELGRRDMAIGRLERELGAREERISGLEGDLAATRTDLSETRDALAREIAAAALASGTIEQRIHDLGALEHSLNEARLALRGTGSDLDARTGELAELRATLEQTQTLLAEREAELAQSRQEGDAHRVAQVEGRTRIMVIEGERGELAAQLAASRRAVDQVTAALKAMTTDRDSERLRADALAARAVQAEAGLAAADSGAVEVAAEAGRLAALARKVEEERDQQVRMKQELEVELAQEKSMNASRKQRAAEEVAQAQNELRARDARFETEHAEAQTLHGALAQVRAELARTKQELSQLRREAKPVDDPAARSDNAALRQEIVRIADQLLAPPPSREAAE